MDSCCSVGRLYGANTNPTPITTPGVCDKAGVVGGGAVRGAFPSSIRRALSRGAVRLLGWFGCLTGNESLAVAKLGEVQGAIRKSVATNQARLDLLVIYPLPFR